MCLQTGCVGMREGQKFKWLHDLGLSNRKSGKAIHWEVENYDKRFAADRELIHWEFCFGCAKLEIPNLNIQVEFLYKTEENANWKKKIYLLEKMSWEIIHRSKEYAFKNILYSVVLKNDYEI